jgi:hypothetical protein
MPNTSDSRSKPACAGARTIASTMARAGSTTPHQDERLALEAAAERRERLDHAAR